MVPDESRYALPIALAALQLSFHTTVALLENNLLSPGKRHECAQALQTLHLGLEALGGDDQAIPALAGLRDLIDRLTAPR